MSHGGQCLAAFFVKMSGLLWPVLCTHLSDRMRLAAVSLTLILRTRTMCTASILRLITNHHSGILFFFVRFFQLFPLCNVHDVAVREGIIIAFDLADLS